MKEQGRRFVLADAWRARAQTALLQRDWQHLYNHCSKGYRLTIEFLVDDEEIIPIDIGTHDRVYEFWDYW